MVAIHGIGGVPEPTPERPAKLREARERESAGSARDGDVISSEAQAAARLAQLVQEAKDEADVRSERVEAARENLRRGDYKNPDVVAKVAEKISKYLP
jgi:anti-sigma28 factor (negative regulator of flagellin synthesis)